MPRDYHVLHPCVSVKLLPLGSKGSDKFLWLGPNHVGYSSQNHNLLLVVRTLIQAKLIFSL